MALPRARSPDSIEAEKMFHDGMALVDIAKKLGKQMCIRDRNNTVSGIEKGDFYCYEVKSSVEDFHSKNGHNFIGDFNYYVMPEDVYEKVKDEIPYKVGVLVPEKKNYRGEWYDLKSVKKSARKDRERPVSEMLLMMFRSAARERNDK